MSDVVDEFEGNEYELGISPLGMVLVVISALIGLALFLDPGSVSYDVAVGGVIVLSIALSFGSGLQRWENEGNLPRVLLIGVIGSAVVSILVTVIYTMSPFSTIQSSDWLVLTLPAVFETLLFCGGVYLVVKRVLGTAIAVVVQAATFALYHFARNPDITYTMILFMGGVVFMLVFLASKNILSAMVAHALTNLRPLYMQILMSPVTVMVIGGAFLIYIIWRVKR